MISQNDISLASASNAIVVAFNVSASVNARKLAKSWRNLGSSQWGAGVIRTRTKEYWEQVLSS